MTDHHLESYMWVDTRNFCFHALISCELGRGQFPAGCKENAGKLGGVGNIDDGAT